jgi:peroxiredoxin
VITLATVRHYLKIQRMAMGLSAIFFCLNFQLSFADDFKLTDTTGKSHSLAAYKGQWVLVNFWATWCPPCLEEIPEFAEIYAAHKNKDLMVFGVAVDIEDKKQVFEFAEKQGMNYPLVLGDDKIAAQFGKINVLPTTFLYDPKGKKVLHRVGPLTRAELEKLIGK